MKGAGVLSQGLAQSGCSPVANNEQWRVNVAVVKDREGWI